MLNTAFTRCCMDASCCCYVLVVATTSALLLASIRSCSHLLVFLPNITKIATVKCKGSTLWLSNIRYKMQSGAITVACGSCACAADYSCVRQKHAEQCPVCETMRTLVFSIRPHMLESVELSHVLPLNLARCNMELKWETTQFGSEELLLNFGFVER